MPRPRLAPLILLTLVFAVSAAADTWTRDDAAHLLRRAGFGGTPQQIDALHALGRSAAVDYLLIGALPDDAKPVFPKADLKPYAPIVTAEIDDADRQEIRDLTLKARQAGPDSDAAKELDRRRMAIGQKYQRNDRVEIERLRAWWIDRMLRTDRPLEEKVALFWHNLFTSGYKDVKSAKLEASQISLFHDPATAGNYKRLTHAILHDGAMLRYLNNDQNVKGKPNENLARELMELFTLGEGKGYTEQDIKEVARALTGLAPAGAPGGRGPGGPGGPGVMRPFLHDNGDKTIFGQTGNFGPDDVVDLIFAKQEPADYLAKRLWSAFAYPDPSAEDIAPVTRALRDSKYDVAPALRAIFTSPAFYADKARFALIKSPAELTVGTMRLLGRPNPAVAPATPAPTTQPTPFGIFASMDPQAQFVNRQMIAMDQELLQPPNVRGWVGGDNWITAATLFTRYNTVTAMVTGAGAAGGPGFGRPNGQRPTPEQIQQFMQQRGNRPNGPSTQPANPEADAPNPERRRQFAQRLQQDPELRQRFMQQMQQQPGGNMRALTGGGRPPLAPVDVAKLLPTLSATPTPDQVVDAAIAHFLQRPLHAEKRQALLDALGDEPLKVGAPESDARIRQTIALLLSTPEYQLQ